MFNRYKISSRFRKIVIAVMAMNRFKKIVGYNEQMFGKAFNSLVNLGEDVVSALDAPLP